MKKYFKIALIFIWGFVIFKLLTFPTVEYDRDAISFYDKIAHFLIFGILSYLIISIFISERITSARNSVILAILMTSVYSAFCEYVQYFVPGRYPSVADFIFGFLGSVLAYVYYHMQSNNPRQRLLLHICCIGCGVYIAKELKNIYKIKLFFYNPNIFPKEEYDKRLEEISRVAKGFGLPVIIGEYKHEYWRGLVRGRENDPEKGDRCLICYKERLEEVAKMAKKMKFDKFGTTLTISPHKDASIINNIGLDLSKKYRVSFLDEDFKKNNGFKKSCEISKELNLYRQNYCGCEFSMRRTKK